MKTIDKTKTGTTNIAQIHARQLKNKKKSKTKTK